MYHRVTFAYDHQGRRVERRVGAWELSDPNDPNSGAWGPHAARRYVWGSSGSAVDWLLLAEFDVDPNSMELSGLMKAPTGSNGAMLAECSLGSRDQLSLSEQCGADANCLSVINNRIAQMEGHCSSFGGDVYLFGAQPCP